jgi:hypothetical protein
MERDKKGRFVKGNSGIWKGKKAIKIRRLKK